MMILIGLLFVWVSNLPSNLPSLFSVCVLMNDETTDRFCHEFMYNGSGQTQYHSIREEFVVSLIFALSLVVISELSIHEDKMEEFLNIVSAGLEVSRNFSGNQGFNIYVEKETPGKVLFIEQWESEQHFQSYYQWRLEQGDFETLGLYFSSPPVMRFYEDEIQEPKESE